MDLQGPPAEVRLTLTIKRADTGKEETYDLIGRVISAPEEQTNVNDPQHGSAQRGD